MVTLFIIGMLVFTLRLARVAFKAAWGITKGVLVVVGIPVMLLALFVAGMTVLAVPLLILALLAVFLAPVLKHIS